MAVLVEVRATVEILEPPPADRLVFWALQASFSAAGTKVGAGHFGLQHHPQYPEQGAVNWGGYHDRASGKSGELAGSALTAPSALQNLNTCNYRWESGRRYTYRISRSPERGWRGSIIDDAGAEMIVRDLHCDGDHLTDPMVWTESFAHCDDPSSSVRWTDFEGIDTSGRTLTPYAVRVNYQAVNNGGCSNTSVLVDGQGDFIQRTSCGRVTAQGATIPINPAG